MTRICNAREKTEYDRYIQTSKKFNEDAIEKQTANRNVSFGILLTFRLHFSYLF